MFRASRHQRSLLSLAVSSEEDTATMAWNILNDERIAEERLLDFEEATQTANFTDERVFQSVINLYHKDRIQSPPKSEKPAFLLKSNDNNVHGVGLSRPHGNVLLARVVNLSRMSRFFDNLKGRPLAAPEHEKFNDLMEDYRRPRKAVNSRFFENWLDQQLSEIKENSAQGFDCETLQSHVFLKGVVSAMGEMRTSHPFEPTWATLWSEFERDVLETPSRWAARLGVRNTAPSWLLVLAYPCREATKLRLVRPTQLDAGWYPPHFPSPASSDVAFPMDLNTDPSQELIPEFIHRQIVHKAEHLMACVFVETSAPSTLASSQCHHKNCLEHQFGMRPASSPYADHPHSRFG